MDKAHEALQLVERNVLFFDELACEKTERWIKVKVLDDNFSTTYLEKFMRLKKVKKHLKGLFEEWLDFKENMTKVYFIVRLKEDKKSDKLTQFNHDLFLYDTKPYED